MSPNRPKDSRSNSVLPRAPHLREDSVIALACNCSPLATSTPEFCGGGAAGYRHGDHGRGGHVDAPGGPAVRGATLAVSAASRGPAAPGSPVGGPAGALVVVQVPAAAVAHQLDHG